MVSPSSRAPSSKLHLDLAPSARAVLRRRSDTTSRATPRRKSPSPAPVLFRRSSTFLWRLPTFPFPNEPAGELAVFLKDQRILLLGLRNPFAGEKLGGLSEGRVWLFRRFLGNDDAAPKNEEIRKPAMRFFSMSVLARGKTATCLRESILTRITSWLREFTSLRFGTTTPPRFAPSSAKSSAPASSRWRCSRPAVGSIFVTSVWGVGAGDLNKGLCRLARPALQFTTSDASRWHLTVHGAPSGQVTFLHEFYLHRASPNPVNDAAVEEDYAIRNAPDDDDRELAFLEETPPRPPDRPLRAFDGIVAEAAEMGDSIPETFLAEVRELPYSAAVDRYRYWHAERIADALDAAGILLTANLCERSYCGKALMKASSTATSAT